MATVQTIDAIWAKRASERLKAAGLPAADLVMKAGIKPYLLNQKDARIPFRQHAELLNLAAMATENSCFGLELAAKEIDPRDNGLLVYVALSSKTFGESLKAVERYCHVLNEALDIRSVLKVDAAIIEFDLSQPKAKSLRQAAEFGMVNAVRSLRFLTGIQLRPIEVSFTHLRDHEIAKFERFFGCPVRFGAKQNSLTFSRRQLALPIATADDRLLGILTGYCEEILADRDSPDLRHQVERIAMRLLSRGEAETRNVALELGMSVRTLARRLNESGATFAEIRDRLRSDLAQNYLKDASLTPSQITFLLGYSEVSALRACSRFFSWCEDRGLELDKIRPHDVAAYIEGLQQQDHSAPSIKQQLAAVRMLFDWLITGQVMPINPAAAVRGPKHVVTTGKTPVLEGGDWRKLIDTIPTDAVRDLRDRALIATLTYSFARIGAALKMKVENLRSKGASWELLLHEKGGKQHKMPCHHALAEMLHAYIASAGIAEDRKGCLFRTARGRKATVLSTQPMAQQDAFRMIRRRAAAAGISASIGNHSMRATGLTAYLENGGQLEHAQTMAAHSSPRTTKLYDRTKDRLTQAEVEKIRL